MAVKGKTISDQSTILVSVDTPFKKSRRKVSLDEFAMVNSLRIEEKSGFKRWLQGEYFHFDDEWEQLYKSYKQRKLNDRRKI